MKNSILIDSYNIFYYDNEKTDAPVILFVHGWGADKDNLRAIYDKLMSQYRIISIDLPGFGESTPPDHVINSLEFMEIVHKFIVKMGLTEISYVGHSFGGKVGILLSATYPDLVRNLILIDSAGLKPRHNLVWYCKVYSYKCAKFFIKNILRNEKKLEELKNKSGSADYRNAGKMRNIMVTVVNEDWSEMLPKIKAPTFLYWGEKDKDTPVWMAHKMNKLIADSGLFIVPNAGHFSFLTDLRIVDIIRSMVK